MRRFPNTGKYMLVVAAGLLLAGCCRSNKVSISQDLSMNIPIELGVYSTSTKGKIDNLNDMVSECYAAGQDGARLQDKGFGVYGYKTVAGITTYPPLFNNTRVYPEPETRPSSIDGINWTYQPLRYWDLTASYQFIAYWPYLPNEIQANGPYVSVPVPEDADAVKETEKILTLHNIPNWQLVNGAEKDVMTATSVGRYNPDYSFFGKVRLSFYHLLSQLEVRAYYIGTKIEDEQGGVVIEGINLMKSDEIVLVDDQGNEILDNENHQQTFRVQVLEDGTTEFSQRYYEARAVSGSVDDDLADAYQLPWNDSESNKMIAFKDEFDPESFEGPTTVNRWLMVPHKWQEINLEVTYKIGTEANSKISAPVPVTLGAQFDHYVTLPGKKYVITLLIDTSNGGLTVGSVGVETWTTHDVQRELYNW